MTPDSLALLKLFNHFRAGRLARAGGVLDQPALYLDAMELIERAVAEIEESKRRERESQR